MHQIRFWLGLLLRAGGREGRRKVGRKGRGMGGEKKEREREGEGKERRKGEGDGGDGSPWV